MTDVANLEVSRAASDLDDRHGPPRKSGDAAARGLLHMARVRRGVLPKKLAP